MATKKKTVSELNKIVENLEEKVKHLEEEVKNMKKLEEKLKHLEENIKIFKSHSNKESESLGSKRVQESVKCRKCDCNFKTTKLLRDHMKSNHMSVIKCNACDITFDAHWKLEKHLSKEHNKEKTFDCEVCDQSFYTNWRLKKHTQSHDEHDIKYCHYFNNSKKCPYMKSLVANLDMLSLINASIKKIVETNSVSTDTSRILQVIKLLKILRMRKHLICMLKQTFRKFLTTI